MDRRAYSRFRIDVDGLFLLQDRDIANREFEAFIEDISEGGFCLSIDEEAYKELSGVIKVGDNIHFTIPDEYSLFGKEISDIITGQATILRKSIDNGNIILGCKFLTRTKELETYISQRRTSLYMNNIKRNYLG